MLKPEVETSRIQKLNRFAKRDKEDSNFERKYEEFNIVSQNVDEQR